MCISTRVQPRSAHRPASSGSPRSAVTSLTFVAPASSAAAATAVLEVSTESAATPSPASAAITGSTRSRSSVASTASSPGRVDSPPTSRISAPAVTSSRPWATARSGSRNSPPSENESGVTLTIPIRRIGPASRNREGRAAARPSLRNPARSRQAIDSDSRVRGGARGRAGRGRRTKPVLVITGEDGGRGPATASVRHPRAREFGITRLLGGAEVLTATPRDGVGEVAGEVVELDHDLAGAFELLAVLDADRADLADRLVAADGMHAADEVVLAAARRPAVALGDCLRGVGRGTAVEVVRHRHAGDQQAEHRDGRGHHQETLAAGIPRSLVHLGPPKS